MRRLKAINQEKREVNGGFVQRINLGDRWAWRTYDAQGKLLPFTARTLRDALGKLG